ncbi:M16 family metallopeptidase [Lignipirellula cremea]|uniref:Peptidase M16 inactive domain protein n=1 Tax=Lignipirellula cremea TaxID=2528010 RepID=A0A518DNA5_9BACT|nr:pitrilysin family protein [Lignipirellula cremea]QDU93319.1 Peptidase M16 inactive domain protein [Lignipirellula cremea]
MRFSTTSAILIPLLLMSISTASAAERYKEIQSVEGITEYQWENGLQVLLFPDNSSDKVTVNLTIFTGSRQEGYGEAGMAHLLEHMLFKGTPTNVDVPKLLQDRGARFNGTTWLDRTNYYETLPASEDNLEFAIQLEADRMVNSNIKGEDLASEMTVVRNEFEKGENEPRRILSQRIHSAAFDWHNYGKSTIGNRSDIERVPLPKLRAFYRRHYQPDNAMLMIAGNFDRDQALALVDKYFGVLARPDRELDLTYTEEPAQDGERIVKLRRVGDVALVGVGYHTPAGAHEDFAAVRILSHILAMEPGGRLYDELVGTKKASSVSGYTYGLHDPGLMLMTAEVRDPKELDSVREAMLHSIEHIAQDGVTEEEVNRAKAQILKSREEEVARSDKLAVSLSDWASQGDWRLYFLYRDRIKDVTPADVKRVAGLYLQENNRTVGLFIPTDSPQRISVPQRPDVKRLLADYKGGKGIAEGEKFDASPANIEARTTRGQLPGGIKTALLPKKNRGETVVMSLTLRYGDLESLKGLVTACRLLPEMMTRGAAGMNHLQLQDALDAESATLNAAGAAGEATFVVKTKRENLPAVLKILTKIVRQPDLPEEELEVIRRERLAKVETVLNDPQYLASYRLRGTMQPFPKDDVRHVPTLPEQLTAYEELTLDDLKRLNSEFLSGQAGELVIVGDFDPEAVQPLLEKMTADWDSDKPYAHIPDRAFNLDPMPVIKINTPDKENAVYYSGMVLPMKDSDPDYPALVVGNFIFGGSALASRLGDRVRQQEGLSYGVSSHLISDAIDPATQWMIAAICNPVNADKLEVAISTELERLLKDGVTEEELKGAIRGYLQQRQVARTDDNTLVARLRTTLRADRTMAFYAEYEKHISELTTEQVLAALRKHFQQKHLITVIAGDLNKKAAEEKSE